MSEYQFVGVDISKAKFDVCINNTKLSNCFENNAKGFKKFVAWLNKKTAQAWVCLEETGSYSEGLAEYLYHQSIRVSVVNPMQVKNYAKSILARNKNDRLDARIIGLFAETVKPRCFKPRPIEQKRIREQVQLLDTMEQQQQQLKNQLDSVTSKEGKAAYRQLIRLLEKRKTALEKKIALDVSKHAEQSVVKERLISIKGVGEKSAHALMAYLPDIKLFDQAKQLAAYAGLSPRQWQSGTLSGKTTLSKFGNARLRKALYMPALVVKNHNSHFKAFCKRLEENGLTPKAIVGAVMRKLMHIIYGMLKHDQVFNPELV
jgi:transposase